MTDYKKYINALRKCAKEHENDITPFAYIRVSDLCRDTANLLEEVESKTGRWIPVSERLPKPGEYIEGSDIAKYYLVQTEYGDMLVARYTHSEYWEEIHKLQPIGDRIVAWRPLPEPYVKESEE